MAALGSLAFGVLLWGATLGVLGVFVYVAYAIVRDWLD